jgi:plasmid stabilization system protein ParE
MSLRVILLAGAEQDLRELRTYIVRNFGKEVWQASYGRIKEAVSNITSFPLVGAIPPELEKLQLVQYRQVLAGMNRIIYEVRQDIVYIHIICYSRKDMVSLLNRRLMQVPD